MIKLIQKMEPALFTNTFKEVPVQEQQRLNGGVLPFLLAIGVVAVTEIIRDWDNFKNGLTGEPEEK